MISVLSQPFYDVGCARKTRIDTTVKKEKIDEINFLGSSRSDESHE
ncbi:hypothetical protein A5880_002197 [Enterococcus sp. 4G2_DIV0659]|uniref:Uncharacterized protein n=1 Tax=Candidatus Enterococcus mansonii TaxID=1834181 RepID=A0A242CGQ3_9ENTE|nr:hypothetical protein A5880_000102 [Enterococcus sp. 4G2_DIV0659]